MLAVQLLALEGAGDLKKLQGDGDELWRLRVGNWRVMFTFETEGDIRIVRVKNRRDAYD